MKLMQRLTKFCQETSLEVHRIDQNFNTCHLLKGKKNKLAQHDC